MGKIKVKMKLSQEATGALYMKCIRLEDENKAMESVFTKIADSLGTPQGDVFALGERIEELLKLEGGK